MLSFCISFIRQIPLMLREPELTFMKNMSEKKFSLTNLPCRKLSCWRTINAHNAHALILYWEFDGSAAYNMQGLAFDQNCNTVTHCVVTSLMWLKRTKWQRWQTKTDYTMHIFSIYIVFNLAKLPSIYHNLHYILYCWCTKKKHRKQNP